LTICGPGALTLLGGNTSSLAGPVNVNSGTLIAASPGATGTGAVSVVSGKATLEISGNVTGVISVEDSGTLYLNGGTAQGSVVIAAIGVNSPIPGGILQGAGVILGEATVGGVIQSSPRGGGILVFQNITTVASASFFWRLLDLVDNTNSKQGVGWNSLQFDGAGSVIGSRQDRLAIYLDFSSLRSGPDGGNSFWSSPHSWTVIQLPQNCQFYCTGENFFYSTGNFATKKENAVVCLTWTPASAPQSFTQRRIARAKAARIQSCKETGS